MAVGDALTCYCGTEFEATNNRQKYCSSRCAQRLLQKRWNDQHPEKRAAIARRYKDRHPEKVRALKEAARRRAGQRPKGEPRPKRLRPVTPRMPEGTWDPQRYYLDKQHGVRLLKTYGITAEDYQRMWDEQGGVCAICHQPETQLVRRKTLRRLCVDHNAKTGKVRALLCAQCNLGIGNSQENPEWFEAAASYLRFWNTEEPPEGG